MRSFFFWMLVASTLVCGQASAAAMPALPLKPCPVPGTKAIGLCGRLPVPEDWSRQGGRKIQLNIVVLPKTGAGREQAPLFGFQGGPGVAATPDAALFATDLALHRVRRAVVLFDQRGTGGSNPLHCRALEKASPLSEMYPAKKVAACARELSARADLRQYTTETSARDIDAVRAALGYAQVDLMGLSYGTILAQAYMKLYPQRVRTAALMGTVPLGEKLPLHHAANAEAALRAIFADCRSDPACGAAFPRLENDWQAMNLRLKTSAVAAKTGTGRVVLQSGPFLETTRSVMNTIFAQRALPEVVHLAAGGNFAPFLQLFPKEQSQVIALGVYLSITCPEGTQRISSAEAARATAGSSFGRYRIDEQIAACQQWPAAQVNPDLLTPLSAAIPVLLIAGGRDSTAPPAWARKVAATLPNSRVLEIEPLTHLPVGLSNMICMDQVMDAFYARGSAAGLDTSCIATMKPPPFVTRTPA